MNVIFLDIDGVMNSELFCRRRNIKNRLNPIWNINWFRRWTMNYVFNGFKYKSIKLADLKNKKYPSFKHRFGVIKRETDKRCWKLLNSLVRDTKCFICISSTWRRYFTIDEWNMVFSKMGLPNDCCIGITESRRTLRGEEIHEWLSAHPKIEKYAIIDDDRDMMPHQLQYFYNTDFFCGLTPGICYRIKRHFNNEE